MENTDKNDFNATIGNTMLCDGFLIPMTDFVLQIDKLCPCDLGQDFSSWTLLKLITIKNYATFLKQPLKLEMFVPCDEDGDILDEPMDYEQRLPNIMTEYDDEVYRYKQAKEKVLFEGFEFVSRADETWLFKINGNFPRIVGKKLTIESLRIFKDKIKLSQTALNIIFGKTVV